ncbi:MAG: LemA family protein [Lachnospiraceae bacterium]|nr:LemA family protein [Lachnospiraceae bacterium]
MDGKKIGIIVAIGAVLVLILGFIGGYNNLVNLETGVQEMSANIDTQLQRRADLIPNLVKTVKSYAEHETEVFDAVNEAREHLVNAQSMAEKSAANEEVSAALSRLVAIAENYPDLKSDKLYIDLMDELAGSENRISYAREEYNAAAARYNKAIRRFPGVIFANMFGFEKVEMFEAAEGSEKVPDVDL